MTCITSIEKSGLVATRSWNRFRSIFNNSAWVPAMTDALRREL